LITEHQGLLPLALRAKQHQTVGKKSDFFDAQRARQPLVCAPAAARSIMSGRTA
jgi:hypothetical protein